MEKEKRFAGKMAEDYDLLVRAYPEYGRLHEILAQVIRDHPAREDGPALRILEIGCGSGITTNYILSSRTDLVLTALDNEPCMIEQIRSNLGGEISAGRLTVEQADALEFLESVPENSVETVASGFTLHNFTRDYRSQVMEHIRRVLVSGGSFVNADKYTLEGQAMFDELGAQLGRFFDAFVPLGKLELLRDWVLHNVADQAPVRAMTERESIENMKKQGFADVRVLYRHGLEAVVAAVKQA